MLIPKNSKFRKFQKKSFKQRSALYGFVKSNTDLSFGQYGIKVQKAGIISSKLLEGFRRTLTRNFNRKGKIWIKIFPRIAVTKKPLEVRMGKGKGNPQFWVAPVKTGQVLFEVEGIQLDVLKKSVSTLQKRSPIPLGIVTVHQ